MLVLLKQMLPNILYLFVLLSTPGPGDSSKSPSHSACLQGKNKKAFMEWKFLCFWMLDVMKYGFDVPGPFISSLL